MAKETKSEFVKVLVKKAISAGGVAIRPVETGKRRKNLRYIPVEAAMSRADAEGCGQGRIEITGPATAEEAAGCARSFESGKPVWDGLPYLTKPARAAVVK